MTTIASDPVLEVVVHEDDPGAGQNPQIHLVDGVLKGSNEFAQSVLDGQRRRNPGMTDTELLTYLEQGWSNGWVGIRVVPTTP